MEYEAVRKVANFYIDLVEKNSSRLRYYLSNTAVLDWFGRTVKNERKVRTFLIDEVGEILHHFETVTEVEKIAFREIHHIAIEKKELVKNENQSTSSNKIDPISDELITPAKKKLKLNDDDTPLMDEIVESEQESSDSKFGDSSLKFITIDGAIEFRRVYCSKNKSQNVSKWRRPTKLHIGYTCTDFKALSDCVFYLIIYEGNLRCRRNLLKEFID